MNDQCGAVLLMKTTCTSKVMAFIRLCSGEMLCAFGVSKIQIVQNFVHLEKLVMMAAVSK